MNCFLRRALGAVLFTLTVSSICFAADPPAAAQKTDDAKKDVKVIKPEDAKDYEGKEVTVEFKVVAAKEASGVCFLNSSSDRDDPKRFTAFIGKKALTKMQEDPKTEKPASYYNKKTVRVTGKVKKYNDAFEIEVTAPDQIKIVEEEKKDEKKS